MPYNNDPSDHVIDLIPVSEKDLDQWLNQADPRTSSWLRASGFKARSGSFCLVPDTEGELKKVVFGCSGSSVLSRLASLPASLPAGDYRLRCRWSRPDRLLASLGWGLACYRFERYRKLSAPKCRLVPDEDIAEEVASLLEAQCLVRDLVNTPTEDLGPTELVNELKRAAQAHGGTFHQVVGEDLLDQNYPAVHAVGRAAQQAPRIARLEWGKGDLPLVVLVGKGVCFDSGGLNIKPGGSMALMKKDMGGAAHVIALARLIMNEKLPVRLMVLVPAVENAISGNAYRPGDVINTRLGKSIEIGNTDAEGRLILCDALADAMEHAPDLVLDFATLTGAARVAMGPDIPPVFSNDKAVADGLVAAGTVCEDPLWELPLHRPYLDLIKSEIADINNAGKGGFAGAITAALFLQEFVDPQVSWAHVDTFAWTPSAKPGRPVGGEALGLRAAFQYLKERYSPA